MSFQERRALASLVGTVLINVAYAAVMIQRYPSASPYSPDVFRFWGVFFLILIPVTIFTKIIIYIVFNILNAIATREVEDPITDERDQLIDLKSTRNSLYVFPLGFLLAMVALVIELPPAVMFIILTCAGIVSELVSDISQFYFYRRGF
jgi:hypothetical protein